MQRAPRTQIPQDEHVMRKKALLQALENHELSIAEATRQMRLLTGMSQPQYAEKVLNMNVRVLQNIERGKGNPTLETLQKIAKPFGLRIAFVPDER